MAVPGRPDDDKTMVELIEELKAMRAHVARLEALIEEHDVHNHFLDGVGRPADLKEALSELRVHDHLGIIYETPREWYEALVPFVLTGVTRGDRCIFAGDTGSSYQLRQKLYEEGLDVAEAESSGCLLTLSAYLSSAGPDLDADAVVSLIAQESEKAVLDGFSTVRIASQTDWALRSPSPASQLLAYESMLDGQCLKSYPLISFCQYNQARINPGIMRDIMKAHPFLVRRNRLQRNFYYQHPSEQTASGDADPRQWLENIDRQAQVDEATRRAAFRDPLTGLPNRLLFTQILSKTIEHACFRKQQLAVFLLDLDKLKGINDSLGHRTGDRLLKSVAVRLRGLLREKDTVGRLGGDEFLVLLPEVNRDGASTVAERLLHAFRRPFVVDGHELRATASVGMVVFPAHGTDPESLMTNADIAMYRVKERGGDGCQYFE